MTDQEFLDHLAKNIPITSHFGISSLIRTQSDIVIGVRLQPHLNHKMTAFGGSLYSLAALAAYGLLWTELPKAGIKTDDIVIQNGQIDYLSPVKSDFFVKSIVPANFPDFIKTLKAKGKSRIGLQSLIQVGPNTMAIFSGQYVAVTPTKSIS